MGTIMYVQIAIDSFLLIVLIFLFSKYYFTMKKFEIKNNIQNESNNKDNYIKVKNLIDNKVAADDIASSLKIPIAEVKLIKNLKSF
ncbi:MAG: hypothetical protein HZA77_05170 [Candidatus Schekmanbacteria bacterium]|nr:hypothetical protein [Candidatus Schekmanbacteria bacterium]